ncbi:hypothetical protein [Bradyrhizobium sp. LHD-71]|uniref:hypothetical protein n=1 Tax=Bradyrhizobium sp. LHD-71 TaxID=3072141 RepID=UPI00280FA5F9|nr:hypothetical protein [Bradyrhizobium sp. LHD-71]MDQ8729726.1 hypothetical protein [Bradyrhizobium sp. LHD-71]
MEIGREDRLREAAPSAFAAGAISSRIEQHASNEFIASAPLQLHADITQPFTVISNGDRSRGFNDRMLTAHPRNNGLKNATGEIPHCGRSSVTAFASSALLMPQYLPLLCRRRERPPISSGRLCFRTYAAASLVSSFLYAT